MVNDDAAVGHQVIRGLPENLPVLILRQAAARISPRSVCALQQHQRKSIDGHHEIDVAALDMEGRNLVLGECKFWSSPVGRNVVDDLQEKSVFVPWHSRP